MYNFLTIGNETINIATIVYVVHDSTDDNQKRVTTLVFNIPVFEFSGVKGVVEGSWKLEHRYFPYDSKAATAIRKWFTANSTVLSLPE